MLTRPTYRPPTTSKQAKADFRKYGPRISTQEDRRSRREAELYERAEKIKQAERRRKEATKKRLEREAREREARHRMGIPSQRPALPRSQILLEGFLQPTKINVQDPQKQELASSFPSDCWSDDELDNDLDDGALMGAIIKRTPPQLNVETPEETVTTAASPLSGNVLVSISPAPCGAIIGLVPPTLTTTSSETNTRIALEDAWDDFLMSNTQIEREITPSEAPRGVSTNLDSLLSVLSTQDVSFTEEDLEEITGHNVPTPADTGGWRDAPQPQDERCAKEEVERKLMPPPPLPLKVSAPHLTSVSSKPDIWLGEFMLSTQDLCDVAF